MSEPIVSQYAAVVFMGGIILASLGALAIGYAVVVVRMALRRFRLARLGKRLLEACGGSWEAADKAVDSSREATSIFAEALLAKGQREYREHRDYAKRSAEFYDACANDSPVGGRWKDMA
jgi:hypothetical protein